MEKQRPRPPLGDMDGLHDWCDEMMENSMWAGKSDDAHLKQSSMYID